MSETETAATARRNNTLVVRGAEPADHEAIGGVVLGASVAHLRYVAQMYMNLAR